MAIQVTHRTFTGYDVKGNHTATPVPSSTVVSRPRKMESALELIVKKRKIMGGSSTADPVEIAPMDVTTTISSPYVMPRKEKVEGKRPTMASTSYTDDFPGVVLRAVAPGRNFRPTMQGQLSPATLTHYTSANAKDVLGESISRALASRIFYFSSSLQLFFLFSR